MRSPSSSRPCWTHASWPVCPRTTCWVCWRRSSGSAAGLDALRVLTAGEVAEQSRNELGKCGLAARKGCRSSAELIERVTQISGDSARKRIKTGRAVRARLSLAGERLPAEFARSPTP